MLPLIRQPPAAASAAARDAPPMRALRHGVTRAAARHDSATQRYYAQRAALPPFTTPADAAFVFRRHAAISFHHRFSTLSIDY
jgi:hypothetical protein